METIRAVSTYAISNREEFEKKLRAESKLRQAEAAKETKRKLNRDLKRISELDTIIKKLYESLALGKITDERFDSLIKEYEDEQNNLWEAAEEAKRLLSSFEEDNEKVDSFVELAQKYTDFTELTTPMINEFIEKIIVNERGVLSARQPRQ